MTYYDTVLFDLDGTLIDSNETIILCYLHAFAVILPHLELSRAEIIQQIGPPLDDIFSRYADDAETVSRLVNAYRTHYRENETDLTTLYPGVLSVLQTLHERGVQLGVVTTKRSKAAWPAIRRFGLDQYIDVYVFLEDVSAAKPDPEPVYEALARFRHVDEALMVGDNQSDLIAAQKAGIACAGVAWSIKGAAHLQAVQPDIMLPSMHDLLNYVIPYGKEN